MDKKHLFIECKSANKTTNLKVECFTMPHGPIDHSSLIILNKDNVFSSKNKMTVKIEKILLEC